MFLCVGDLWGLFWCSLQLFDVLRDMYFVVFVFACLVCQVARLNGHMRGWSNVLFVYSSDVFFGLTEICGCLCAEDVQADFGSSVYFVSVLLERHSCIIGHAKGQSVMGVLSSVTVGCVLYSLFQGVISVNCGFGWGDF